MAVVQQILGAGISPLAAQNIAGSFLGAQTALGTNQATAYILGTAFTEFTAAAASTGCTPISTAAPGDMYVVFNNNTTQTITFYPPGSDTINNAATSFAVATNKTVIFFKVASTHWCSVLTA